MSPLYAFIPVAGLEWPGALLLLLLVGLWVLIWLPPGSRRIQMTTSIDVRCSPDSAYAFVSNPNNWHRYIPPLELITPVDVPLSVGSTFRERLQEAGSPPLEAEERVIVNEPGSRFGTTVADGSSGISDFVPIQGGTRITYTYQSVLSLSFALGGGVFQRQSVVREMAANRARILLELKRLLEAEQPATV